MKMTWKREEAVDVEAIWDIGEVGAWNDPTSEGVEKRGVNLCGADGWFTTPQGHMAKPQYCKL